MPEYLVPGVYVEEIPSGLKTIEGVSTSTTAFVGRTRRGPSATAGRSAELNSFADFEKTFGGLEDLKSPPKTNYLAHAVRAFFSNGGRKLYVARVKVSRATGRASFKDWQKAFNALATWKDINLVAVPGSTEQGRLAKDIQSLLIAHVERPDAYRFAVLDVPKGKTPAEAVESRRNFNSKNAAFYYPWVTVPIPRRNARTPGQPQSLTVPPSGFLCGIYARSDLERGVFKAPANEVLRSATGFERQITASDQETLNSAGVNCLLHFAGKGFRVWGARTASSDPEWKYVNVRRYFNYLENSIDRGTQWAVFEPNDEKLWAAVHKLVSNFLSREWRNGGLPGRKAEEAFFVRCDRTTMTQSDLDNGRLICLIGVAPVKPSEFVIFRIDQCLKVEPEN